MLYALEREAYSLPLDFGAVSVESIQKYLDLIKQLYKKTYDRVALLAVSPETINFNTAVQPLINLGIYVDKAIALCTFPKDIHTDESVRVASAKASAEIQALIMSCGQRNDVYQVFKMYVEGDYQSEKLTLSSEQTQYVEKARLDYRRNGLTISDSNVKARVIKIHEQLSALSLQFSQSLEDESTSMNIARIDLDGLPDDWFTNAREGSLGHYKVTFRDIQPILEYANNRTIREKIFTAFNQRCEAFNLPVLKNIFQLRSELAQKLNYSTYADYTAETRLAGKGLAVKRFLDQLNERFTPLLDNNLKTLTDFARHYEQDASFELQFFDMGYYQRLWEEKVYNINPQHIKEYFPEKKVIDSVLVIYEQLFGLKFIKRTNLSAWHPDVSYFDVYNDDPETSVFGEKLGGFYLDLYKREGKCSQSTVFPLQNGCDVSHLSGVVNERQLSISAMVCHFPKDENLLFDELSSTFFHEFGHLMHFVCAKTQLVDHVASRTEKDFVEVPSQMLEHWCFEPRILEFLSAHSLTQKPLPQELVSQLRTQEKIHAGYLYKRQLVFAYFDFYMHTMSVDDLAALDIKLYFNQLQSQIMKLPMLAETCIPASFEHIAQGDGYYRHLWSKTFATDLYNAGFQQDPFSQVEGSRYRQNVLKPGASKPGMQMLEDFLGRPPSPDAFYRRYGISQINSARRGLGLFDRKSIIPSDIVLREEKTHCPA